MKIKQSKKERRKEKHFSLLYLLCGVLLVIINLLSIKYKSNYTSSTIFLSFLVLLSFNCFLVYYKLLNKFYFYFSSILIFFMLFLTGTLVFNDIQHAHYKHLEILLGVNKITFIKGGIPEKDVITFLNNVNPKYTKGINEILILPSPLFSFSVQESNITNETIFSGEADGRYDSDTKNIIFVANDDFKDSFYHEVGHYIYMTVLTDADREEWINLFNISIEDYIDVNHTMQIYNLPRDKVTYLFYQQINSSLNENFADGFASITLNESSLKEGNKKEYIKKIIRRIQ